MESKKNKKKKQIEKRKKKKEKNCHLLFSCLGLFVLFVFLNHDKDCIIVRLGPFAQRMSFDCSSRLFKNPK
jgi:hypothetical protein